MQEQKTSERNLKTASPHALRRATVHLTLRLKRSTVEQSRLKKDPRVDLFAGFELLLSGRV
jgi:hypothetical protein